MTNLILSALLILCLAWPSYALSPAISQGTQAKSGAGILGDETDYGSEHTDMASEAFYCVPYTASASGSLGYGYIHHYGTASDNAKVCVYNDDGSLAGAFDGTDTKRICSTAIAASADQQYKTGAKIGGTVENGVIYIVCVVSDTTGWDLVRTSTSAQTLYYTTYPGGFASPPNTIGGEPSSAASRAMSVYVEIE